MDCEFGLYFKRWHLYTIVTVFTLGFTASESMVNVLGFEGETVVLNCALASARNPSVIEWRFHGNSELKDLNVNKIRTTPVLMNKPLSTLQISSLSAADAGTYSCRQDSEYQIADVVSVKEGQKLTCNVTETADKIFTVNETITVKCDIQGISGNMPPFIKFTSPETWSSEGMEWSFPAYPELNGLGIKGRVYFRPHDASEVPMEVNIRKIVASNEVYVEEYWISPSFTVHYPPNNLSITGPSSFSGGEELKCTTKSLPEPEYYWILFHGNESTTTNGSFITTPAYNDDKEASNTYKYQCVATNVIRNETHQVRSLIITVKIDAPPPVWPIIVGGVVGGVALLAIVLIIIFVVCHQRSVGPITCPCID